MTGWQVEAGILKRLAPEISVKAGWPVSYQRMRQMGRILDCNSGAQSGSLALKPFN